MTITPPGRPENADKDSGVPTGYSTGRKIVAAQIHHLMKGTTNAKRVQDTNIAAIHKAARNSRGRVNTKRKRQRILVPADALRAYVKMKQGRVGYLASGWNRTAQKVGYKPPEWIARHGSANGSVRLHSSARKFSMKTTNAIRYARDVDGLERRIQVALNMQANNMERKVDDYLQKQAASIGLKVKK